MEPTISTIQLNKFDSLSKNGLATFKDCENQQNSKRKGASWYMCTFLLVNSALGAGILNYPVAYDRVGGIASATIMQVIMLAILATTMITLAYCAELTGVKTYHELLEQMCGRIARQMVALSILVSCFGICVTILIIIGDQFDRIFATFFGDHFCGKWWANRIFTIVFTTVFTIWPMSYFKRLDFLKHVNMLGVLANIYVIFLNVYEYYKLDVTPGPIKKYPDSILKFIAALPIVCMAYQTHEILVPVYGCLKNKSVRNFGKATTVSLILLFVLNCLSGTYGYLTFGSKVASDIMLMYEPSDPIVFVGIVALIIKHVTTYPLVLYCGRDTFVDMFFKKQDTTSNKKEVRSRLIITSIWNVTILLLAVVTPNITVAIGFLGSLAACNVFVFPGMCMAALAYRMYCKNESNNKCFTKLLFSYGIFVIITGVIMFFIILYQAIIDLSAADSHVQLCKKRIF